jgi:AcrR family transcriptional regulator
VVEHTKRSGAQTRDRLLDAARAAFARRGYHGTTTAEIAAVAGCSEPTLFKHFGSKQALLVAAVHATALRLVATLETPLPPGRDPFEAFAERARSLLLNPSLGELSRLRTVALALSDEVELGDTASGLQAFLQSAAEAVAAGQAGGSVRPDLVPADVAQLVFAIALLFGFRSALDGDEAAAAELAPVVDSLLTMLRVPERQLP